MQYTLLKDRPNYPAGTVITLGTDGRYHSADGVLWVDADVVENSPSGFGVVNGS